MLLCESYTLFKMARFFGPPYTRVDNVVHGLLLDTVAGRWFGSAAPHVCRFARPEP